MVTVIIRLDPNIMLSPFVPKKLSSERQYIPGSIVRQ
jgi:hypothetical protein